MNHPTTAVPNSATLGVRRRRAALVAVDEIAREHILRLGVLQLRLTLQVPVEHRGGGRVEAVLVAHLLALGPLLVHGGANFGGEHLA